MVNVKCVSLKQNHSIPVGQSGLGAVAYVRNPSYSEAEAGASWFEASPTKAQDLS
jgi:hypothetical protein